MIISGRILCNEKISEREKNGCQRNGSEEVKEQVEFLQEQRKTSLAARKLEEGQKRETWYRRANTRSNEETAAIRKKNLI